MKRKILRFLLIFLSAFLLVSVASAILLYSNRDKLTKMVIDELSTQLIAPVKVESVSVSLNKFPSAAVLLNEVYSSGVNSEETDSLIHAKSVFLEFSLWKMLFSDLVIDDISIEDGQINIARSRKGEFNYQIWKSGGDSTGSIFSLERIQLRNIKSSYTDSKTDFELQTLIRKAWLKGSFDPSSYLITVDSELSNTSSVSKGKSTLKDMELALSFDLEGSDGLNKLSNGQLKAYALDVGFSMEFSGSEWSLLANSKATDANALYSLALEQGWYDAGEASLDIAGKLDLNAKASSKGKATELELAFIGKSVNLKTEQNIELRKMDLTGVYTLNGKSDKLVIDQFSGESKTGTLNGQLEIEDLDRPRLSMELHSQVDFKEYMSFVPSDTIESPSGKVKVDLNFSGAFSSLKDLRVQDLKRSRASGTMQLENIAFGLKDTDKRIKDLDALLNFDNNDLRVESFIFNLNKSDLYLSGTFRNFLAFLFFEDEVLVVDANMKSQEVRLADFLFESEGEAKYRLDFVEHVSLDIDLEVDKFLFEKFYASSFRGRLLADKHRIEVKDLRMNMDKGSVSGAFGIDKKQENQNTVNADLEVDGVDIHDLFVSFDNFGQESIKADNIFGKADSRLQFTASMDDNLRIAPSSIDLKAAVNIKDGNLKNYAPMTALSNYARIEELRDVRFEDLTNSISISNSMINIPAMAIRSNVMNLDINGTHDFDNNIDYGLKLKLSDVLFKKRRNKTRKSEFDDYLAEAEEEDDPNIYIKMTGAVSDPQISLDTKSLGKSILEGFKKQGKELKDLFSKDKKDKTKEDPGIIYEWDEDDDD